MKNLRDCLGDETPRYVLIEKATPFILLHKKKGFTRYVRGSSNEDETRSFRLPSNHTCPLIIGTKSALAQSLVSNLLQFKNNATHFPTFYATIAHDYKGNIEVYVNDMLKKSILLDIGRHDRFLRKPSSFKMANDLGVQFVIGIAMYRLWMKEQANK